MFITPLWIAQESGPKNCLRAGVAQGFPNAWGQVDLSQGTAADDVPSGEGGFEVFCQVGGESRPAVVAAIHVDTALDFDQGFRFEVGEVGSWSVKVVNELDRCSKDAQDMLLTYLDRMKPGDAFLGTTNLDLASLTERFQTRFQSVRLQPPENEVLAAFLARRWGAPIGITRQIAAGARGNVRAAMADLEMWMG